ncbi:hypothetical protein Q8F55_002324 [Vanrija albida]|uniref:Uncharacterized protein n=1 Tax=Vanrija albida TaxID=181172 RepID=A0ABR3Q9F9_9TREE
MSARHLASTLRAPRPRPSTLSARPGPQPTPHRTLLQSAPRRPELPLDVPPISARLRPLVPFFIAWSVITTLAVHLLRGRKTAEEEQARAHAQESVLLGLAQRFRDGEDVSDTDIRRELEMVGLRERTALTLPLEADELREVSWFEVFLGRRKPKAEDAEEKAEVAAVSEEQAEAEAVVEWSKIVNEATKEQPRPEPEQAPARTGTAKRAASASVFI